MADQPAFESPVITIGRAAATGSVVLTDESSTTKTSIRAADGTPAAATLGLTFGSGEVRGDVFVGRTRPDEWTVLGSPTAVDSYMSGLDLSGFASTVDITHSRLLFRLTGAAAAKVLEKVCSIDFADQMTPNLACIGASVAKVACDLIRDDVVHGTNPLSPKVGRGSDPRPTLSYRLLADRSFGQYLFEALIDAKNEFH